MYSDDGGATWHQGFASRVPGINLNEANVTEIGTDGQLLFT